MTLFVEQFDPYASQVATWATQKNMSIAGNLAVTGTLGITGATTLTGPVTLPTDLTRTGEQSTDVTNDKTLAAADCGIIQNVTVDAKTITLPSTAAGLVFTIRNGGADGAVLVTVAPAAADKIQGNGFTAADNKAALNTKATAKKGDRIILIGDGVDGWFFQTVIGTWARAA